jgi:cation diffusion facilitator CzcD-associated flavoprotein CzcO
MAAKLKRLFPRKIAYRLIRYKNILYTIVFYNLCKYYQKMKNFIINGAKKVGRLSCGSAFYSNYNPWEQRFVLQTVIFLKPLERKSSCVTDQIDRFISNGIVLKSGQTLEADIIITATGLDLVPLVGKIPN